MKELDKEAIEMISVPMFNSGYADKEGNIFYIYSAKFPNRNLMHWAKTINKNQFFPPDFGETLNGSNKLL